MDSYSVGSVSVLASDGGDCGSIGVVVGDVVTVAYGSYGGAVVYLDDEAAAVSFVGAKTGPGVGAARCDS